MAWPIKCVFKCVLYIFVEMHKSVFELGCLTLKALSKIAANEILLFVFCFFLLFFRDSKTWHFM